MNQSQENQTFEKDVEKFVIYAKRLDPSAPNKSWYVGISKDPMKRKVEHERKKGITCESFEVLIRDKNKEYVQRLEKALEQKKFAITNDDLEPVSAMESQKDEFYCVYIYRAINNESDTPYNRIMKNVYGNFNSTTI